MCCGWKYWVLAGLALNACEFRFDVVDPDAGFDPQGHDADAAGVSLDSGATDGRPADAGGNGSPDCPTPWLTLVWSDGETAAIRRYSISVSTSPTRCTDLMAGGQLDPTGGAAVALDADRILYAGDEHVQLIDTRTDSFLRNEPAPPGVTGHGRPAQAVTLQEPGTRIPLVMFRWWGRSVAYRYDGSVYADWGDYRGSNPMGRRLIASLTTHPFEYVSFDETDGWQLIDPFENIVTEMSSEEADTVVSYIYGAGDRLVSASPLRMGWWGGERARVEYPERCRSVVLDAIADPTRPDHIFLVCGTEEALLHLNTSTGDFTVVGGTGGAEFTGLSVGPLGSGRDRRAGAAFRGCGAPVAPTEGGPGQR